MPNGVTVAVENFYMFTPPGDCLRSDTFFPRKLAMPNGVTVAVEKFYMFTPPGDCLRSDTSFA